MVTIVIVFDSIIVVFVIVRGAVVSVRLVVFSVNFVKADVVIGFEFACLYDMNLSNSLYKTFKPRQKIWTA